MKQWIALTGVIAAAMWVPCTVPSLRGDEADHRMLPEQDGTIGNEVNKNEFPLGGKGIAVTLPDGRRILVPARVEAVLYYGKEWSVASPDKSTRFRSWFYYELRSKDPALPHRWSIWATMILDRFILFNTPDGENILTWVDGSEVCCAEVSKPNDRQARFKEYMARRCYPPPDVSRFPVSLAAEDRLFVDEKTTGHTLSIYVISAAREGKDGYRIQFTGKDRRKVYTVVTDKTAEEGWRVEKNP